MLHPAPTPNGTFKEGNLYRSLLLILVFTLSPCCLVPPSCGSILALVVLKFFQLLALGYRVSFYHRQALVFKFLPFWFCICMKMVL